MNAAVKNDIETVWRAWTEPEHIVNWYFASDEWHCPAASNDFTQGGAFSYTLAAKDGSAKFDYDGSYAKIVDHELIEFSLNDGRLVTVSFTQLSEEVQIQESFEPDHQVSPEMQKMGWQAILNNFCIYTEKL